ncbi:MAG: ABC transporter substrate-binding protein [Spirochaetota bacterium]|nr:MAG: ABC transporter substrate-binding protein [Spirochaetota bacterium]
MKYFKLTFFLMIFIFIYIPLFSGTGVDSLGNKISIPDEGVKIVSLAPGATEILYELGLQEEIVGISEFCNYPPELVASKPKMGGFSTPDIEKIQAENPDVIILTRTMPIQVKYQFERLGMQLFVAEPKSLNELLKTIIQFGNLFNRVKEAHELVISMESRAGEITEAIRERSTNPVRTMIIIWNKPYYTASRKTLPGDIVQLAGGRIVPDTTQEYLLINEERILQINPEALILGHEIEMTDYRNIESIRALRNNKVFLPNPDEFLRPGPRVINALTEIAHFLHPEAF